MSEPLRLILVDDDPKSRAALAFGLEREGLRVLRAGRGDEADRLLDDGRGDALAVHLGAGGDGAGLVRRLRRRPGPLATIPVVALGDDDRRLEALAAGADDFLVKPAFVRDAACLVRLLGLPKEGASPRAWAGPLEAVGEPIYLIRALVAARRTGVVALARGMRRGEVRLFEGEVTSAQLGVLHGIAAFHQLLLWRHARFDLRAESVVRRQ
jgi:CheY-like chemotaxis protein